MTHNNIKRQNQTGQIGHLCNKKPLKTVTKTTKNKKVLKFSTKLIPKIQNLNINLKHKKYHQIHTIKFSKKEKVNLKSISIAQLG